MLIEKKDTVAENDVVCFRVLTGEEIIGKLISQDDASVTLTKPIVAQLAMIGPNEARLGFGPFMATIDEDKARVRFERSKLLTDPLKARKDIAAQYTQMTTGLAVPAQGLLKP
jgi:hypothetical protein